ncbi:MAG: transposase, partial [Candidatus Nitrosocosmicus sp.]
MPYRQTEEGIAQGHANGKVPSIPDYSIISRKINKLDIKINDNKSKKFKNDYIIIAIDIQELKLRIEGQWMRDKWKINNKNKGYLKIHIATVDVKSKKILSMKITADEYVHDINALP